MGAMHVAGWIWAAFLGFVGLMMALDLGVFRRPGRAVGMREAAVWSAVWIGLALAFWGIVWAWRGSRPALEFLTGWVIEESLSLDNLFVFLVIFRYFSLPVGSYRLVLTWGILGAIILRGLMILVGAALLAWFAWVLYLFGAFLVLTAFKLWREEEPTVDPGNNVLVRAARTVYPVSAGFRGERFFVVERGRRSMTPLLVVLLVVSWTDVVFATDSIPAVFAVTRDPFIVFTSNMFAVMGLRSVFFLLVNLLPKFRFLRHGLALVLGFIGVKMLAEHWIDLSIHVSLLVVAAILAAAAAASVIWPSRGRRSGRT